MTPTTEEAIVSLRGLTKCTCHEAYSGRGMEDPNCLHHEYAEYVEALAARVVALEEVVKVATEALAEIDDKTNWEINPSNYDHDDVCNMNSDWCEIGNIAQAARAKLEDRA